MADPKILIVDDDEGMRFFLTEAVRKAGHAFDSAVDGKEALEKLEGDRFGIVFLDIKMPRLDGLTVLGEIRRRWPEILVVMMTAFNSKKTALDAIQQGAYDYFTKPLDLDEVRVVLKRAVERVRISEELHTLRDERRTPFLGESPAAQSVRALVEKVAPSNMTVLIAGESGAGKEVVAREIHARSPRRLSPFVVVDGATIPENLWEQELFGHEKGAFTGATESKPGRLELARGGVIFFDEIGDLPLSVQAKILRLLQEKEFDRVGGRAPIRIDVRFIAATKRNLAQAVSDGSFREDLFYRLNGLSIEIPPLRDRREDIPALVAHHLAIQAERLGRRIPAVEASAMKRLARHDWPGNVREVVNVIGRLLVLGEGKKIGGAEIEPLLANKAGEAGQGLKSRLEAVESQTEKGLIEEALSRENGGRTAAAKRLGISRKNLYNKMRKYGLL